MTPESIDWDAEAKRVARAFGIEEECEFRLFKKGSRMYWRVLRPLRREGKITADGVMLSVRYNGPSSAWVSEHGLLFCLEERGIQSAEILFRLNGRIEGGIWPLHTNLGVKLARALFHLNLLTPEVERALKVAISDREKLIWLLDYQARYA